LNNISVQAWRENGLQAAVRWGITLVWATLIFKLSTDTFASSLSALLLRDFLDLLRVTVTPAAFDTLHHLFRKTAHVTEYAIFSMLLYHCLLSSNRTVWRTKVAVWSVLIAGAYSLTDEFHQLFVPGRTASLWDCGIDTAGALVGMLVVLAWTRFFARREPVLVLTQEKPADELLAGRTFENP
jgi:VanZ family protein